jgi:hypothetical protein
MIKKRHCWTAFCDNCGEDVFGYSDYNPHFETKEDIIEALEDENIDVQDGKHFCSTECWRRYYKIKE